MTLLKPFEALAKPWSSPRWILLILIGINRVILRYMSSASQGQTTLPHFFPRLAFEIITAFLLALFLAFCVAAALKIFNSGANEPSQTPAFRELLNMTITSQSPYLMAGPCVLAAALVYQFLGADAWRTAENFLHGFFPAAVMVALYVSLRRQFLKWGELAVIGLTLSPWLMLVGCVFAGLVSIFLLIAAVIVIALIT
ncbi:MAG: hypothetical protein HY747_02925 [Elusimicrobia bacterium]|nr:hypothetical protein [Elusimicrobiota bacterium]